jgi:hypothetical protein
MSESDLVTLVSDQKPARNRDWTALSLLIAVGFALAITCGVTLSGAAMGTLQQALRSIDFGRDAREAAASVAKEQRQQAQSIGRMERVLDSVVAEIATINSRIDVSHNSTPLRADMNRLNAAIAKDGLEIAGLRSSITENEKTRREEMTIVNKRLDRLETLMTGTGHDLTGSIRPRPQMRPRMHRVSNWSVDWAGSEGAVVSGNGETHAVTSGSVIPGLGRVSSVRQRGDRWIVVTEKGIIAQRTGLFGD